jgi:hypothetical protein
VESSSIGISGARLSACPNRPKIPEPPSHSLSNLHIRPSHSPLLPSHSLSIRPLTQRAPPTRAPTRPPNGNISNGHPSGYIYPSAISEGWVASRTAAQPHSHRAAMPQHNKQQTQGGAPRPSHGAHPHPRAHQAIGGARTPLPTAPRGRVAYFLFGCSCSRANVSIFQR